MSRLKQLNGINKNIYDWAINSLLFKRAMGELENNMVQDLLVHFLGENEEQRELAAVDIYRIIWGVHAEVGPMPAIDLLRKFEHDRVFYDNYRDHTTHSVKIFLIGLYIYEYNDIVRTIFRKYIESHKIVVKDNIDNVFVIIWSITALYHDIGYLLENEKIEENAAVKKQIFDYYNQILCSPLANTPKFASHISQEKEYAFIEENKIFTSRINTLAYFEHEDLFCEIKEASNKTGLSLEDTNGVLKYYELAKSGLQKNSMGKYRDHGICSALILVKIWSAYKKYIADLCTTNYNNYYKAIAKDLSKLNNELDSFYSVIKIAAEAISLHNINKENWNEEDALAKQIDLKQFSISMSDVEKQLPFAFLLRMADEIQTWDRPRFRAPAFNDGNVRGSDMELSVDEEYVYLRYYKDEERFKYPETDVAGNFFRLKNYLQKYLEHEFVERLLKYGTTSEKIVNKKKTQAERDAEVPKIKRELLQDKNKDRDISWLVGAVNLDEDIHFSSFYLFNSIAAFLPQEYKKFGYKNIIAIYNDFNETYYVPENECIEVSQQLIKSGEQDCNFWDKMLKTITQKIGDLEKVFQGIEVSSFAHMSNDDLLNLYKKHNNVHKDLYVYARIPEALDRGNSTFTNYLKEYLRKLSDEFMDEDKLGDVFQKLTYPENLSYTGLETVELYRLIQLVKEQGVIGEDISILENIDRRMIYMNAEIKGAIKAYANKWALWGYHGYRNRVIRDFNYFVEKLCVNLKSNRIEEQGKNLLMQQETNRIDKALVYARYDIDDIHKALFRAFSQIGTIKIYRRYVQLNNFYYLDYLISEIANRYNTSEAVIRCLLPNEVVQLLSGDLKVLQLGKERSNAKVIALEISEEKYNIVIGDEAKTLYEELKEKTHSAYLCQGELRGEVVSRGADTEVIRGTCHVLSTVGRCDFHRGDILVCMDSDPDLFEYIKIAGAVLTETGGLTCHAAIVCRELRVACIVRIQGLLENLHEGDSLEIDPKTGEIRVITSISEHILKSYSLENKPIDHNVWGRKASALIKMKQNGVIVPDFACIPLDILRTTFSSLEIDGNGMESQAVITEIRKAVEEINAPFYAVRSSTLNEDQEDFSGAGQEITRLHVASSDVLYTLETLLAEMDFNRVNTKGSIVIQRMIFGELSGVLFTKNPLSDENHYIIETVRGGNDHLTSGKLSPTRYVLENDNVIDVILGDKWGGQCSANQLRLIMSTGQEIESIFGVAQDIEWTIADNKLYVLQSRDITGQRIIDSERVRVQKNLKNQHCMTIYQNYALPLVLQNHLLRVAAVGKWIIEHWINSSIKLNAENIIEVLLLHDIGNIVKGEDDNFKALFPDTYDMESFEYWINMRNWVREHYGNNDLEATQNIVKEIGVSSKLQQMIEAKQFYNNKKTYESMDYAIKICAYADQRVAPEGIMSLNGRLNEAIKRYQNVKEASVNRPDRKALIEYAKKIEEQIFENVNGTPEQITDESIDIYIPDLKCHLFRNLNS